MIKKLFEKITGLDKIRIASQAEADAAIKAAEESTAIAKTALDAAEAATKAEEIAKMIAPKKKFAIV